MSKYLREDEAFQAGLCHYRNVGLGLALVAAALRLRYRLILIMIACKGSTGLIRLSS